MKKTILLISMLTFFLLPNYGTRNNDSILMSYQNSRLNELNTKVDSLLKATEKFNEEKNYFTTALSSQTTIFTLIISIIVSLIGLVSFLGFKFEIKKYKEETQVIIDRQNKVIESFDKTSKKHDDMINEAFGSIYVMVATANKKHIDLNYIFSLKAAKHMFLSNNYKSSIANLESVYALVEKNQINEEAYTYISTKYEKIEDDFQLLLNCKNETLKKLTFKIYHGYLEFMEKQPKIETKTNEDK